MGVLHVSFAPLLYYHNHPKTVKRHAQRSNLEQTASIHTTNDRSQVGSHTLDQRHTQYRPNPSQLANSPTAKQH
jgi:hypothetical protein